MKLRAAAALALLLALVPACAQVNTRHDSALPPPPTTVARPSTATSIVRVDTAATGLLALPGTIKRSPVAIGGGEVTITGFVSAGGNAAGSSQVILERLVGDTPAGIQITANPDGTFALPGVLGGRFRVFGYRVPDLVTDVSAEFFAPARTSFEAQVKLRSVVEVIVDAVVSPKLRVGQESELTVRVAIRQVVAGGAVQDIPTPDLPISLITKPGIDSLVILDATTDKTGSATWTITCSQESAATVDVKVGPLPPQFGIAGTQTSTLQLTPCSLS